MSSPRPHAFPTRGLETADPFITRDRQGAKRGPSVSPRGQALVTVLRRWITMLEEHRYEGYWWLPAEGAERPPLASSRLCGTLTISQGSAELQVLGHFGHEVLGEHDGEQVLSGMPTPVDRILGLSTDGKPITVEKCRCIDAPMSFPGIAHTTYRAESVVVGAWFEEGEVMAFDELSTRTAALDAWVDVTGFSQHIKLDVPPGETIARGIDHADVGFVPPARVDVPLSDGEAWIDFAYSVSGVGPGTVDVTMSQRAWLHLRRREPMTLDQIKVAVGQLRNFLSLAVGRSDPVVAVTVYQDALVDHGQRLPMTLYWRVPHNIERRGRPVHPIEMLFTLAQVEPGIDVALDAWFGKHPLFEPVINLYFGMLHHPDVFLDVRFLTLAQAVETYDFRRRDPNELSRTDHNARMKAVLDGSPDLWRDWLRMRLSSSNYWTLDQRMRAVLGECDAVARRIVGDSTKDRDAFVRSFKNSRNYYTHYTPSLERKAAKGESLLLLVTQLRAVIEMSLLRELGFDAGSIEAILDRGGRFMEIAHFRSQVN